MPRIFQSIIEFSRHFSTEKRCWQYLVQTRWPGGFICPICGAGESSFLKKHNMWECKNKHHISVTSGTVMHKTKMPLLDWFWAAFLMSTQTPGISAYQLARKLNIRYETAYMMLQKLRVGAVNPGRKKLSGMIMVDETTVGGEGKGGPGRAYSDVKSIVLGAVEVSGNKFGRIRLRQVKKYKGEKLIGFIKDHVEDGSEIVTDGFRGYAGIPRKRFKHTIVEGGSSKEVAKTMYHIHIVFTNLKAFINGTYHGVSRKHLQTYLNEFVFRFNRRNEPMAAFNSLLGIGSGIEGPEYREIYDAGHGGWQYLADIPKLTG